MERILAMLLSVLFSIFNNTPYQASEKPHFNTAGIYKIQDEDGYTTQELNTKSDGFKSDLSEAPSCGDAATQGGMKSPVAGRTLTDDELEGKKYTWTQNDIQSNKVVVMPETATVCDDSNLGNGGHDLTLKSGNTTFIFKGMQCRYSDANKEQQEVWNDTDDLTGKTINAGAMVGIAKVGTTLEIKQNGKAITLKKYYTNKN